MPVKLYSAPHCGHCKKAKSFFQMNNIAFDEVDVTKDRTEYEIMLACSHQSGVPVIEIGNHVFVGWNRKAVEKHLKSAQSRSNTYV